MKSTQNILALTREFTREIRFKSWATTLSTLFILLISLSLCLLNIHWFYKVPASVFSGLVIVRMFVIYHDYLHETILQKSKLANVLFTLFGYYILTPKTVWKRTHNFHHAHNSKLVKSGIGSYPVYTKKRFEKLSKEDQSKYLFIRHPLVILLGYYFTFLYGMCINSLKNSFSKHLDSLYALLFHLAIHTAVFIFFGWQALLFFSIIPHFVSGALGAYLFYIQHNFPSVHYCVDDDWTYEGAALESSSFLDTNRFMHWVSGNIGYHHIHHLNPRIPFYRLPEVMKRFKELQSPKRTTLNVRDIINCLRLKVWDAKLGCMVHLKKM
ncbi:MAG: fatty acid desaturase [Crocinitomicaceae bacterium]|nr:fatty acid desaturase [Crocinitomicaceae bacterium]